MSTRKLQPADVERIFSMRNAGHSYAEIADAVGCSLNTVCGYVTGRRVHHAVDPRTSRATTPERAAAIIEAFKAGHSQLWVIANLHVNQETIERIMTDAGFSKPYSGRVHNPSRRHLAPQIVEMVNAGRLQREIASELGMSLITVNRIVREQRALGKIVPRPVCPAPAPAPPNPPVVKPVVVKPPAPPVQILPPSPGGELRPHRKVDPFKQEILDGLAKSDEEVESAEVIDIGEIFRSRRKRTSTPAPIKRVEPLKKIVYPWMDDEVFDRVKREMEESNEAT